MDLIITILPVVTKDLPISPRFTPYNFLSRCKFSTLTTRQPMVEFYLLTFPRFPLRKKEHKSYFGKNRTHDFRTSRCAAYLLDHSGDELQRAYDSVDRTLIWQMLACFGVPPQMIEVIRQLQRLLRILSTCKNSCRKLPLKRYWNVCGVLFEGCCMLTTRASCRGRRAGWGGWWWRVSTIGEGGDTTTSSPGRSPKKPLSEHRTK